MIYQFRSFRSEFGVCLDHHGDQVLELFFPLLNEGGVDVLESKWAFENVQVSLKSLSERMATPAHKVVENTSQAKYVYFLGFMRVFKFVVTLV